MKQSAAPVIDATPAAPPAAAPLGCLAVSNLAYGGFPIGRGRPQEEEWFREIEAARRWLKERRCGGSIVAHLDGDWRRVEEVLPG